jgi:pentatricopeptide repeat protein
MSRERYLPIAEHGLIGDLHTVALVGTDGTIDWYCCPRFDSPSVFAAILDADRGGLFRISPTFSMCSFWWVEALARAGRLDEARLAFEKMLTYASHVGLYSEEIGPTGELLGNFPEALTHLALISAAYNLDRALG